MVELGFAEAVDDQRMLDRRFFPSKLGGRPAWLGLDKIPTVDEMRCPRCRSVLTFWLQVYAPREANEDAFHRMVYIFACKDGRCHSVVGSIRALRCQLRRANDFYPFNARAEDDIPVLDDALDGRTCRLCGIGSSARDGFCCTEHEAGDADKQCVHGCKELVIEEEPETAGGRDEEEDEEDEEEGQEADAPVSSEDRRILRKYEREGAGEGLDVGVLESLCGPQDVDFLAFQKRISIEPHQVLRYCSAESGGGPLWADPSAVPSIVPPCAACSRPRVFEFQLMPELITLLRTDDKLPSAVDFATIAVYTCSADCGNGGSYLSEHIFRQVFKSS